jgi:PKD repeat protein
MTTLTINTSFASTPDPDPGPGTGTVTATIGHRSALEIAPEYIHLSIGVTGATVSEPANLASYDPTHDGLWYHTDWGDPGAVSDKVVNLPSAHNDLNVSYGKYPSHCYTSPGTYTVTVTVRELDGALVGTDTVNITVADPDTVFTGNRTILVDPADVGDNTTYPSSQVVTTLSAAVTALDALSQTGRILLKRGATFNETSTIGLTSALPNFYVGAYGSGARPIVNANLSDQARFIRVLDSVNYDVVSQSIDWRGPWDSTTETGNQVDCFQITFSNTRTIISDDCLFDGFYNSFLTEKSSGGTFGLCVHNCDFTNWSDYGIGYQSGNANGWWSILGTAAHQHEDAMMGGRGKRPNRANQHGPIRFEYAGHMHMSACDLFSRNGWTRNGNKPVAQPCFRWNTDATEGASQRTRGVVERTAMEGGYRSTFSHHINDSGSPIYGTNLLFDKCLLVGSAASWSIFETSLSGFTFQNCIGVQPNVPAINGEWDCWWQYRNTGQTRADSFPARLRNSTFVVLLNDTNRGTGDMLLQKDATTAYGSDWTEENNGWYQPNATGVTNEAIDVVETAMVTVGGTWTPRFKGARWNTTLDGDTQTTLDTAFATPAGSVWQMIPNASSPLIGDDEGVNTYDDFYGTVRASSGSDRGAVERT